MQMVKVVCGSQLLKVIDLVVFDTATFIQRDEDFLELTFPSQTKQPPIVDRRKKPSKKRRRVARVTAGSDVVHLRERAPKALVEIKHKLKCLPAYGGAKRTYAKEAVLATGSRTSIQSHVTLSSSSKMFERTRLRTA